MPDEFSEQIKFGIRVEVPLRNKLYSGIVIGESEEAPPTLAKVRYIRSIIDTHPIITDEQYSLWQWMSQYYLCTIGEVMNVALPSGLKLNSETKLVLRAHIDDYEGELEEKEYMLAEAISIQQELTIDKVQDILQQKTVYPYIKSLLDKGIVLIKEELIAAFKPKRVAYVKLLDNLSEQAHLNQAIDSLKRSEKQTRAVLSYIQLSEKKDWVAKKAIYEHALVDSSTIKALEKKNIFKVELKEVSRLEEEVEILKEIPKMNPHQTRARKEIKELYKEKNQVLLFGITGSGKTRIYIDLIQDMMKKGKQTLYLLPEIALTTQIVSRLKAVFGDKIAVFHSKMSNNHRVETWNAIMNGIPIILGARSSIFLPFKDLGLIIVDEEHDPSFKQADPAPRYNAKDVSSYMSKLHDCKVLFGTATPCMETFLNAKRGKFGLVKLLERHGDSVLPDISIVDLRDQYKRGLMTSIYSKEMKDAINTALKRKEQVLIFKNRRGYSPTLQCKVCDFHAECPNCDVSLTVHQYTNDLRCHYCGFRHQTPHLCPKCGFDKLDKLGFGTEKIEDETRRIFSGAKVARLDFDTAKTKKAYADIMDKFKNQEINILVGTQMITKGLDFDNISLVCVPSADKILFFPDFKANERAFQLFTQVAGRAGRRSKKGKVIIQTHNPLHPVITETRNYNYPAYYKRELTEREKFHYPPFFRMIKLTIKHKEASTAREGADIIAQKLRKVLGNRVFGPSVPGISRLRGFYIHQIIVKMEKKTDAILYIKELVLKTKAEIKKSDGYKSLRIILDVDP